MGEKGYPVDSKVAKINVKAQRREDAKEEKDCGPRNRRKTRKKEKSGAEYYRKSTPLEGGRPYFFIFHL